MAHNQTGEKPTGNVGKNTNPELSRCGKEESCHYTASMSRGKGSTQKMSGEGRVQNRNYPWTKKLKKNNNGGEEKKRGHGSGGMGEKGGDGPE